MREAVTIVGYGSQARAWAANLRDSGRPVRVALRPASQRRSEVEAAGFAVVALGEAPLDPLVAVLVPDEEHASVVASALPWLAAGGALVFAHGFSVHYRRFPVPPATDLILVAPKGVGPAVRQLYVEGSGVAGLIGVDVDASGCARERAQGLADDLGCSRAGVYPSTFREETEADLFSEQAVLIGGVPQLMMAAFEVLTKRGVAPEVAYFECLHELKLITDLMATAGVAGMFRRISNTAKFGGLTVGARVVDDGTKARLEAVFDDIVSGRFLDEFSRESAGGFPRVKREIEAMESSPIETVGRRVRERMKAGDVQSRKV